MSIHYPDVRLHGSNGLRKHFNAALIDSIDWELIENGYYGNCTINMSDSFDSSEFNIVGTDYIELYIDNEIRYRGYISIPESRLEIPEKKSINILGAADRLNNIYVKKRYIHPGGADIAIFISDIINDYILSQFNYEPGPLVLDIQETGFTIERFDADNSARECLDNLIDQAGKRAQWGIDIDPETNKNRLFVRPKSSAVGYKYSIGNNVRSYSYPQDYSQIVNKVRISGSDATHPNLAANSSFEDVVIASSDVGNEILDSSFENYYSSWSRSLEAYILSDVYPHTGNKCAYFENYTHGNQYIQQDNVTLTENKVYEFKMWHKSVHERDVLFHIEIIPDVGDTVLLPAVGSFTSVWTSWESAYTQLKTSFTAPAGCASCSVKIVIDTTDHIKFQVDDVSLVDMLGLAQLNWSKELFGTAAMNVNWANDDYVAHGAYSIECTATAVDESNWASITQTADNATDVNNGDIYLVSVWIYNYDNSNKNIKLAMYEVTIDSSAWQLSGSKTLDPGWNYVEFDWTATNYSRSLRAAIRFIENCHVCIDAITFTKYPGFTMPEGAAPGHGFVEGSTFETILSTDDDFVQDDSVLPAVVKNSITTYGIREITESVDGITDIAQAQGWAIGYFGLKAQPVAAHRLDISNCSDNVKPNALVQLLGTSTSIDPAFPSNIRYTWSGSSDINISISLNTERPTFEGMLQKILNRAKQQLVKKN